MKHINFFKAYSRLGLINIPWPGTEFNIGVETASDYLLSNNFLLKYKKNAQVYSYIFPDPQTINKSDYMEIIAKYSKEFANFIIDKQKKFNGMQVVIGGDHSVTYSSVLAQMILRNSNEFGYIQFDSHADLCRYSESPSGNFHGMFSRALSDPSFDNKFLADIPFHLKTGNILYIGNLDVDEQEKKYIINNSIVTMDRNNILTNINEVIKQVNNFVSRFNHIHISFDVDVFDKTIVNATGTPSKNGLFEDDIFPILNILPKNNISVDLVEVNPKKLNSERTIKIAQQVLATLIG